MQLHQPITKLRFLVTLAMLFCLYNTAFAQSQSDFYDLYALPDSLPRNDHTNFKKYDGRGFFLYTGKKNGQNHFFMTTNDSAQPFFSYSDTSSVKILTPSIFKSPKDARTVILMDLTADYSHGQYVFVKDGEQVSKVGYINFAADNYNFSALSHYAHITIKDEKLILSFQDVDIIDFENEDIIPADQLRFEILRNALRRIF